MERKKMLLILYICVGVIVLGGLYISANIKISSPVVIGFNKTALMKLDKYSDISGVIDGKTAFDINLQNIFISENKDINTTIFYQNAPYTNYKAVITYKKNNYYINQYLNGKLNGVFSFKLSGDNLKGSFLYESDSKKYSFQGKLVNYNSGKLMLINNINKEQLLYKNFLDYPFYKIHHSIGNQPSNFSNSYGTLEYNAYTGNLIEFPQINDGKIYKLIAEKSNTNYGIDLNKYYKGKLMGTYNLIYSKGDWYGAYYTINNKEVSFASLKGHY